MIWPTFLTHSPSSRSWGTGARGSFGVLSRRVEITTQLLRWTMPYVHLQDEPEVLLPTQEQSRYPIVFCWGPWETTTHLGQDPDTSAKVSRRLKEGAVISCLLSEKSHSSMKLQVFFLVIRLPRFPDDESRHPCKTPVFPGAPEGQEGKCVSASDWQTHPHI